MKTTMLKKTLAGALVAILMQATAVSAEESGTLMLAFLVEGCDEACQRSGGSGGNEGGGGGGDGGEVIYVEDTAPNTPLPEFPLPDDQPPPSNFPDWNSEGGG